MWCCGGPLAKVVVGSLVSTRLTVVRVARLSVNDPKLLPTMLVVTQSYPLGPLTIYYGRKPSFGAILTMCTCGCDYSGPIIMPRTTVRVIYMVSITSV